MNWQPIETAPNDDTLHVRGLWVCKNRTGKRLHWEAIAGRMEDGDFCDHDGNAPWWPEDYSHWMPLPEPPQ